MIVFFAVFAHAQDRGEFNINATPFEVLGTDASKYNNYIESNTNITWEIYVPENYDPSIPAGVLVFAGAPTDVRPPVNWFSVLKDKNIIWVAARASRRAASIHQRTLLAMMSVPLIEQRYAIDKNRVYITGEARSTSRAALDYPEIFKGAIFMGLRLWEDNAEEKIKDALNNKYIFVSRDASPSTPRSTRTAYNKFKKAGAKNIEFMHIRGQQRYNRQRFARSIDFLDK